MKARKVMVMMLAVVLMCGITAAMAQGKDRPAERPKAPELTPEEKAFLGQVEGLRKEIQITQLELALLEAKDAPEGEIAAKAENLYRLQGRLYALGAKHPEMAGRLHRERMRHGRGYGRGRGGGRGLGHAWGSPGMGRHRGHDMGLGMGRGMGHGMGFGGPGMGRGRGMGHGMGFGGPDMGRGRGMGRGMSEGMGFRGPGAGRGAGNGQGLGLEEQGMGLGMGPEMGHGGGMGMRMRERAWRGMEASLPAPDAYAWVEEDLAD